MAMPYRLKKSIQRRDFKIEEVSIGEASGSTLLLVEQYSKQPFTLTMHMIADLAEVDGRRGELSFNDVVKMCAEDISALGELAAEALDAGLPTGEMPSAL